MKVKRKNHRCPRLEMLEGRLCMSASVGWDGPGQGEASLTYYVGEVPSEVGLTQSEFEAALETAMDTWAEVADVTFTETALPNQLDSFDFTFIEIDGVGGTLAQAMSHKLYYSYLPLSDTKTSFVSDLTLFQKRFFGIGSDQAK